MTWHSCPFCKERNRRGFEYYDVGKYYCNDCDLIFKDVDCEEKLHKTKSENEMNDQEFKDMVSAVKHSIAKSQEKKLDGFGELCEWIKDNIDIVDEIKKYVDLEPAGSYFAGVSPWHKGLPLKNPEKALAVSPPKRTFYCFSSGKGGDVIDWIAMAKETTRNKAILHIISDFNKRGKQLPKGCMQAYYDAFHTVP